MNFIKGLELSKKYYFQIVSKILKTHFRNLKHSAGLIGSGSEVLGYDNARSMDHDWGPRVIIFIKEKDFKLLDSIEIILHQQLPKSFLGFPTYFQSTSPFKASLMKNLKENEPHHGIIITTISSFFKTYLGIHPYQPLTNSDWLVLSEQKLRTIRSGQLFQDDLDLEAIRKKLHYYPKEVWFFLLAAEWAKIGQEEPFMGRCGEVGDELGARLIAGRLVQSIMNLIFMMEREYIPYSKWYGTAFSQLKNSKRIRPILIKILDAKNWKERELGLSQSYKILGKQHNQLGITEALPSEVRYFFDRPFQVIDANRYVDAIWEKIEDKTLQIQEPIGSINQITKTVDILENNELMRRIGQIY